MILVGGCGPGQIDPAPPLDDEHHTAADNPLLRGNEETLSCTERSTQARAHVDRALAAGIAGCVEASDCPTLVPSTGCFGACPQPVARAHLDATRQAVADAEDRWCEHFDEDCSEHWVEPESCPQGDLRCVSGECRLVVP